MISINKADPLHSFISDKTLNSLDIQGKVYSNLLTWKFATLKNVNTIDNKTIGYIRLKGSKFLIQTSIYYPTQNIYAIWDIEHSKGWVFSSPISVDFKNQDLIIFNVQSISELNEEIYKDGGKSFDDRAFDLLKSMINSKEHSTKSPEELAIKAIKLASTFSSQIENFKQFASEI